MSMEEERELSPPRKSVSVPRSAQRIRRRKLLEGRNSKAFAVSEETEKEKRKLRNSTKRKVKTTMQRIGSGVHGLAATRSLNGNIPHDGDFNIGVDFQMLKIHDEEYNDADSLSMLSIDSRPSSCTTLDVQEVRSLRNIDEFEVFERLEDSRTDESGETLITAEELNKSELTPNSVSDHNGSSRLQVAPLEEPNNENFEKLEDSYLESINFNIQDKTERGSEYESERKTKLKVQTAWELNDKFLLTADFPDEVWDEKKDNKSLLTKRRPSSDLLNASFPPLSAFRESRRGSLPISSSNHLFLSSKTPPEFPSLSGRQCKVQLPSSFPGVSSPVGESDSESSDNELHKEVLEREQRSVQKPLRGYLEIPSGKHVQKLTNSSARETPNSSGALSPMLSSEHFAIRAASPEYLATRVVTQLDCAFKETVGESHEEVTSRAKCVTPNLMSRRHSAMSFRTNTSSFFGEKVNSITLPSVHNECSKSLPNLSDDDKTKRMFVTFDKDYPRAKVVDLKGKSDVAQKCRVLDRRLTDKDSVVKAMLKDKVQKKSMTKKWVIESAQGI